MTTLVPVLILHQCIALYISSANRNKVQTKQQAMTFFDQWWVDHPF